jgi:soluble lytic murein transglycosylase
VAVKAFRLTYSMLATIAVVALAMTLGTAAVRAAQDSDSVNTPAQSAPKPAKGERKSEPNKSDKPAKPASSENLRNGHKPDSADKTGKSAKPAKPSPQPSADKSNPRLAPSAEDARQSEKAGKKQTSKSAPAAAPPHVPARPVTSTSSIPSSGVVDHAGADVPRSAPPFTPSTIPLRPSAGAAPAPPPPPARRGPVFAMAASATTSPLDLSAIKQALELVHKGRGDEAASVESTITDPVGRKLVEWAILRGENTDLDFARYAAFISANPSWPSIVSLRRRAESALWQKESDSRAVIEFFKSEPPRTAKGRFVLARALLVQGDRKGAQAVLREAWRKDSFSADTEEQARQLLGELITAADDKARMDARFDLEDDEAGLRAARHLGPVEAAIAKARAAVINKSSKAKAALDEVPAEGKHDPGYIFARVQWLRRSDKIPEAARLMLSAPHDPDQLGDVDQWWIERRLIARKLLDLGDMKSAYAIANTTATPINENYRSEQHFTAGWIALRFLREPSVALGHFARIAADGVTNPMTLARAYYWQGRAAEALGHERDARGFYEVAARYSTAYYGQLARARLGIESVALRPPPEPSADHYRLEVARIFEILYALDERDMVASMAADLGDKSTDVAALTALGEIAARHNDARSALLIGKPALSHGLPLEHYAFPNFGIPDYQQIGPQVERSVVYSIVRQESAFNSRVVSSANAIGLMQVTPAAGRDTAKRFNVSFDQHRLMADVAYNAQIGTAELGNDIASWRGSYILAFVAYNAGPRRAKEWIEQYGDPRNPKVDPVDWIERIPISETRNYVQRIIENMQVYRARFDNNPRLLIEADLRRGG